MTLFTISRLYKIVGTIRICGFKHDWLLVKSHTVHKFNLFTDWHELLGLETELILWLVLLEVGHIWREDRKSYRSLRHGLLLLRCHLLVLLVRVECGSGSISEI